MSDYYPDSATALPLFNQAKGRTDRDAALAKVMSKAGESWRDDAIRLIRARLAGREVLAEEFRALCESVGIKPHHPNAWGGLTAALVKAGVITDTGKVQRSKDPRSHARRQPVWLVM